MQTAQARLTNSKGIVSALTALWSWVDQHSRALLIAGLVLYLVVFSAASIFKLETLQQGFDLAGNEQAVWNTLHGHPFRTSVFKLMEYDFDDGPVLLQIPLAGLYALCPSPHILLVLQTLAITLGALPLFWLARDLWKRPSAGLVAAAVYLLHPAVQHMNLYEFQYRSFSMAFALYALYFFEKKRWGLWGLFLLLGMCTKTESALLAIGFGLYALVRKRRWTYVIPPIVVGAAWFYVALFVVVPHFTVGGGSFAISTYFDWLGKTPGDMIHTILTRPGYVLGNLLQGKVLAYLGALWLTGGLLFLLSPLELLPALPILALNVLSLENVQLSLYYQYQALIVPFLLVASLYGLRRLQEWWQKRRVGSGERFLQVALAALVLLALANTLYWRPALWSDWQHRDTSQRIRDARAVIAQLPKDAPVAASSFLAPLVAQREGVYFFPGNRSYPEEKVALAQYILTDTNPRMSDSERQSFQQLLEHYRNSGQWQIAAQQGDFLLLRRIK